MTSAWLVAALCAGLMACSPGAEGANAGSPAVEGAGDDTSARHPESGLAIIDLAVVSGDKRHTFRVELADTPQAQAKGLMFRTALGDNEGMLFPSDVPDIRSFWMKNTPIPLDIIFIGLEGEVINIAANTEPYSLESVYSEGIASAVLELRGGRAAELGIKPGDKVEYQLP